MKRLILLRHGESEWNKEKRFTGWSNVNLSPEGHREAIEAGKRMKEDGIQIDRAFTSRLKRANQTLDHVLNELDQKEMPVTRSWHINERSYGALQGHTQAETIARYGKSRVDAWRSKLDAKVPLLDPDDPRTPGQSSEYADVPKEQLPLGESMQMAMDRIVPFYREQVVPCLEKEQTVLIAAHGNILGVLLKYLIEDANKDLKDVERDLGISLIYEPPTGVPMICTFDEKGKLDKIECLADPEEVAKRAGRIG